MPNCTVILNNKPLNKDENCASTDTSLSRETANDSNLMLNSKWSAEGQDFKFGRFQFNHTDLIALLCALYNIEKLFSQLHAVDTSIIEQMMSFSVNKDDDTVTKIRNYLIKFQELRGMTDEDFNFYTLIKLMGQSTGCCFLALFNVMLNILPLFEVR